MATAVKNIAGLALAPLGAFNAPIISSNVQTIHVLGTTGAQLNTYFLDQAAGPIVLSVPSTNGHSGFNGRNAIVIVMQPSDPAIIVSLGYGATTQIVDSPSSYQAYTVSLACDPTCPLVTYIPLNDTVGTVTLTVTSTTTTDATAMIRTLFYPD